MGWGLADRAAELQQGAKVDVAFRLERDEYRGETYLVARIAGVKLSAP
jgi:single-stranded-DNA-specific exonuclease